MASPRLQCTSLWTSKRKRVKRYEFGRARFANRRAAIDSDVLFSPFFFFVSGAVKQKQQKKEERAHRRGPKRTVERTNGDNSSFPRIAIKSTTRLSVSFSLLFFTTTEWREEVGQQRSQREQRPETRSRQKKRRTVVLFNETGQSASGI